MALGPEANADDRGSDRLSQKEVEGAKGITFSDVFAKAEPAANPAEAREKSETARIQLAGLGDDWRIFSGRRQKMEDAGKSLVLKELGSDHLKEQIKTVILGKAASDGALNADQVRLLTEAEAAILSPRKLHELFTAKQENGSKAKSGAAINAGAEDGQTSEHRSKLKSTVEASLIKVGLKIEHESESGRMLGSTKETIKLETLSGETLSISVRQNLLGPASLEFQQKEGRSPGPRPIDEKATAAKTKSLSLEEGKSWLEGQFNQSAEDARESFRRQKEREQAETQERKNLEEAADKRVSKARPAIANALDTAIDQSAVKDVDKTKLSKLIEGVIRLEPAALKSVFDVHQGQTGGLPRDERSVLKQAMSNLGLRLDKLLDGSALAIHRYDTRDALIIESNGRAKLAAKVATAENTNLDFEKHRGLSEKERQGKMADWIANRLVEGEAFVSQAKTKLDLERRYSRLLLDTPLDAQLGQRVADHGTNRDSVKKVAVDYLVSMSMGTGLSQPHDFDRLLLPVAAGSKPETERLYFQALVARAGVTTAFSRGTSTSGRESWLSMTATTSDGKSYHATNSSGVTVFEQAEKSGESAASLDKVAGSFRMSLEAAEHKQALLQELGQALARLDLPGLTEKDRKAISELVTARAGKSWYMRSSAERQLESGLFAELSKRGFSAELSKDQKYMLISSPELEQRLILNFDASTAKGSQTGANSAAVRLSLINLPGEQRGTAEHARKAVPAEGRRLPGRPLFSERPEPINLDTMPAAPAPEALDKWLFQAKTNADSELRRRERVREADTIAVLKDRAELEDKLERRIQDLLPESALTQRNAVSQADAKQIRQAVAKLVASISAINKDGITQPSLRGAVPWKLLSSPAESANKKYFEACLQASGFSGRLLHNSAEGGALEAYRITQLGSLKELDIAASVFGKQAEISDADRASYRESVEISLKAAEAISRAIEKIDDPELKLKFKERQTAQSKLRAVLLYAAGNSTGDGIADLGGASSSERAVLNQVMRRAGIELSVFDHSASGFSEDASRDLSFRFLDGNSGKTRSYDLALEFDPLNLTEPTNEEAHSRKQAGEHEESRRALLDKLSSSIMQGLEHPPAPVRRGLELAAANADTSAAVKLEAHKISALVKYASQLKGFHQPQMEQELTRILSAAIEGNGPLLQSPRPSPQLRTLLIASLEAAGLKAALQSSQELGLAGRHGSDLELLVWKPGASQASVLRQSFDSTGNASGKMQVFDLPVDPDSGRPLQGEMRVAESPSNLSRQISEAINLSQAKLVADPSRKPAFAVEFAGGDEARAKDGKATDASSAAKGDQIINVYVTERASLFPAKPPLPKFTNQELAKVIERKLAAAEAQMSSIDESARAEARERVISLFQSVKALSEKGAKKAGFGSEQTASFPWTADGAKHEAFLKYLQMLECDLKVQEMLVSTAKRADTRHQRLIIGLPGNELAVVLDGNPYIAAGEDQSKKPLTLRSQSRLKLVPYDAVDFSPGKDALPAGVRALSNSQAARSFANYFLRLAPERKAEAGQPTLEAKPGSLRLPGSQQKAELSVPGRATGAGEPSQAAAGEAVSRLLIEKDHLAGAIKEAELQARKALSAASDDTERERAKADLQRVEGWKGALADEGLAPQARRRLAEHLAQRAQAAGQGLRTPAVLIPILSSIFLATAAHAQSSVHAPLYIQK